MTTPTPTRHPNPHASHAPLRIPKELWSAPVLEARQRDTRPRPSWTVLLLPLGALLTGYAGAAAAARGHPQVAGWLLGLGVAAILALAAALGHHAHRLARYRAETPR